MCTDDQTENPGKEKDEKNGGKTPGHRKISQN
jgi:hypothetical protein